MHDFTDLIDFLRARLNEERARALATDDDPAGLEWRPRRRQRPRVPSLPFAVRRVTVYMPVAIDLSESDMRHIIDHSPQRVIADVDGRLYALDAVERWLAEHRSSHVGVQLAQVTLTALAHRFREHPAFQQTWAVPRT